MSGRFRPGAPAVVFGLVLVLGLTAGRSKFFQDPGTYWHLRLGRDILQTGHVPRTDGLTFSRDQTPWVDQSWGFDVLLAVVVDEWGWPGAVAATALGLAWIYAALAKGLRRDGTSAPVAVTVAILAAGVGTIHFLVRPHLFTFAFVLVCLQICRRFHERGGWSLWAIPLLMIVWANVHGGFLAGPLIVATAGVGHAVSGPWDRPRRRRVGEFAAVFALSCLAPLVNPYGVDLYRHVYELLVRSRVTDLIDEYKPSPFGSPEAAMLEWFVLGFVALPWLSRGRVARYDLAHVLVWLHLSLGSIRHAPLFALAAAPALATLCDGMMTRSDKDGPSRLGLGWAPWLGSAAVILALSLGWVQGGPDPSRWPLSAFTELNRQPREARIFHEQDWGGLIALYAEGGRKAYIDDRFELWGREGVLEYVEALQGGPGWEALQARERFTLVWVRPERALARRLLTDTRWEVIHRDDRSILFRRKGGVVKPAVGGVSCSGSGNHSPARPNAPEPSCTRWILASSCFTSPVARPWGPGSARRPRG